MFQRILDEVSDSAAATVQLASLAAVAAIASLVTVSFLCAAAFIVTLHAYGLIWACLAGAGLFFLVALLAIIIYLVRKRRSRTRAAQRTRSPVQAALTDPRMVALGVQMVRTIGVRRLVPLLAVGGLALGLLAGRHAAADETPAE